MAGLLSLLAGLMGQNPQPNPNVIVEGPEEVDELVVTPPRPAAPPQAELSPPPPSVNPFTARHALLAQQAAQAQAQLPRVSGGTDAGLYGFLPEKVRNGRFRDILGAIGDGILIGAKADPIYGPRKEARTMGQALLGYGEDPQAAIERLGVTGAPGSLDLVKSLQTEFQRSEDRKATREATQEYRNAMMQNRTQETIRKMEPHIAGVLARAKTPEEYQNVYLRLTEMAKRIDPNLDPSLAWGLPHPDEWTPETTAWWGTTGGQQLRADVSRESIGQRREAAQWGHQDRQASIGAANYRAELSNSGANYRAQLAEDGRNARHDRPSASSGGSRSSVGPRRPGAGGGPARPQAGGARPQPGKVNPPVPGFPQARNMDVDWLKRNNTPAGRKQFEAAFGPGTAKRYLGN